MTAIKLLNNRETAELLGVTTHTLDQWRWRRKGPPHVKVGGSIRYSEAALIAWLDSRTQQNALHEPPARAAATA